VAAATDSRLVGISTPLEQETISTRVLRSKEPVYTKNVAQSDFAAQSRQGDKSHYRTGSLICAPLLDNEEAVGVLNLSDKKNAPHFDALDLDLAQRVAAQITRQVLFSAMHSKLDAAYREINQAQQAKEDLMYMVIHDMKAPVTGVREVLRLLNPDKGLPLEERLTYLTLAENDLEQLWRRITNLLDLGKMDANQLPLNHTSIDLNDLLSEISERMSAVCSVNQVMLSVEKSEPLRVWVDEDLAERIIVNLLMNAIIFSSPEEGGQGEVRASLKKEGRQVVLEVADTGPGVDPKLGESIFERYAQGRITKGSTGIGLYFSRRAAWLLGGEVNYENHPDGGAVFKLNLRLLD
jgi:signal transduction histidine kinase